MTSPPCFALIPAAGMGRRMGASINKQYLHLEGIPIVARTLAVFERSPHIDGIALVIPESEIPYCQEQVVEHYSLNKVYPIIPGGAERQQSVMHGLAFLRSIAPPQSIVVIHDGVRPFITDELIAQSIAAVTPGQGALVAVPAKDTIKVVKNGCVTETPDRQTLWQAQTPQAFLLEDIYRAHQTALEQGYVGTDDCALAERIGIRIKVIMGSYTNIKMTTPEDLHYGELLCRLQDTH